VTSLPEELAHVAEELAFFLRERVFRPTSPDFQPPLLKFGDYCVGALSELL